VIIACRDEQRRIEETNFMTCVPADQPGCAKISRRAALAGSLGVVAASALHLSPASADDITKAATGAILQKVSASLLGPAAGAFASGQLLDLLGLGPTKPIDEVAYFNAIEQKIDKVQSQVEQVQRSVDQLTADVANLPGQITDVTFQNKLDTLSSKSNVISTKFGLYQSATNALTSTVVNQRKEGASQLYRLFYLASMAEVSTAMKDVQDLFYPKQTAQTGLLSYQTQVITDAIHAYSADKNNFKYDGQPPFNRGHTWNNVPADPPPNDDGLYEFSRLVIGAHQIAQNTLDLTTVALIRAFLAIQLQGLTLISSAWLGTINQSEVGNHTNRLKEITDKIAAFPADVAAKVDRQVAADLQRFGAPLGSPLTSDSNQIWYYLNTLDNQPIHAADIRHGYQLNSNFIMWEIRKSAQEAAFFNWDMQVLVESPWKYDNCRTAGVTWYPASRSGRPQDTTDFVYIEGCPKTNVPRFPRSGGDKLAFVSHLA
jgi:hypothetical protein